MTADHSRRARGFLWNRKRLIIVGLVTVAIAFVPMFPHSPDCLESSTPTSLGSIFLADDYQKGLIAHLASYDVPYISVGNVVLLRLWTRLADPESWVLNASNKTVMLLAQGRYHGIE